MLFLNLFRLLLVLGGVFAGYQVGMRRPKPRRWSVIAWCTAGGVIGGVAIIGVLLVLGMATFATMRELLSAALPAMAQYTLLALVAAFAIVLIPRRWRNRLLIGAPIVIGLAALIVIATDAAVHYTYANGGRGLVFGPGNVPAKGAPVFLDPDYAPPMRFTTDTQGQFEAPWLPNGYRAGSLLICIPDAMPTVARLYQRAVTVYNVRALPPRTRLRNGLLRGKGWIGPIPPECLRRTP